MQKAVPYHKETRYLTWSRASIRLYYTKLLRFHSFLGFRAAEGNPRMTDDRGECCVHTRSGARKGAVCQWGCNDGVCRLAHCRGLFKVMQDLYSCSRFMRRGSKQGKLGPGKIVLTPKTAHTIDSWKESTPWMSLKMIYIV